MSHARLSPSSRYRWQLCPGSANAVVRYEGDGKSSPAAIDGTHSHTLLEYCIKNKDGDKARDPKYYLGMVLQDHEGIFAPDRDRCDRVRIATDYINSRLAELPNVKVVSERHVNPVKLLDRDDLYGTVDVHILSTGVLEIIDYKDGMNEVIAKDNPQLEQYFFGLFSELAASGKMPPFNKVRLTIIQPKLALKGGNPISFHDYDLSELLEKVDVILAEAAATDSPDAPFVPGEKQCKYCAHKVNCEAFRDMSFNAMGIKFENVLPAVQETVGDTLSDEKLQELILAAPLIRKMLEEAEAEALRRIRSGHPVPGLKVVAGPGRRGWAYDDAEMEAKLKRFKIPKAALWKTSLISPAQAEALRWTDRAGEEHQLTEKQITLLNKELVKKSEGKLTVVPESDRRATVEFGNLSTMFNAVPSGEAAPSWLS
jgi:Protein of unknown function (DUF2800)